MMVRGMIVREGAGFALTDEGRALLETLMMKAATLRAVRLKSPGARSLLSGYARSEVHRL
jgi:hypothetical protein